MIIVWSMVPLKIKNSGSVKIFKTKIRNWELKDCHCYLCKTYINNLGSRICQCNIDVIVNTKTMFTYIYIYIYIVLFNIFGVNILMCVLYFVKLIC